MSLDHVSSAAPAGTTSARRELDAHLAIETDDNIARGMTPRDARDAARRKLGNPTLVREEIYQMNTIGFLDSAWRDLRYGARLLRLNPAFALVAILSLALGVGANTAIFQLLDAVRLRTLPVKDPQQLVEIRIAETPNGRTGQFSGRRPIADQPAVGAAFAIGSRRSRARSRGAATLQPDGRRRSAVRAGPLGERRFLQHARRPAAARPRADRGRRSPRLRGAARGDQLWLLAARVRRQPGGDRPQPACWTATPTTSSA